MKNINTRCCCFWKDNSLLWGWDDVGACISHSAYIRITLSSCQTLSQKPINSIKVVWVVTFVLDWNHGDDHWHPKEAGKQAGEWVEVFRLPLNCLNIIRRSFLRRKWKGVFNQRRHTIMQCSSLTTAGCVLDSSSLNRICRSQPAVLVTGADQLTD